MTTNSKAIPGEVEAPGVPEMIPVATPPLAGDVDQQVMNLHRWLTSDPAHVLVPFERDELDKIKPIRFSQEELGTITTFIQYLMELRNPEDGEPYLKQGTFAEFIQFCINITFRYFAYLREQGG